jgi:hypothetical protein
LPALGEAIMRCPACHTLNSPTSRFCQQCGEKLPQFHSHPTTEDGDEVLSALPALAEDADTGPPDAGAILELKEERRDQRRPARPLDPKEDEGSDIVSTFIPYKNPKALAAYYCGFFALLPGLGFILGAVAITLGIQGVRYASDKPHAKGLGHAITGIVLGTVAFFCWNPFVCFLLWFNYWYMP